ncbi:Coiled-coil domain-containing protein 136 [Merluccius polli]|uniref:Coiled-coil domain-containing protein 136 n=1 Tax=Merluccius polli TaxID=89951 RepID=A0AA47NPL5_MERPO|nr:Coiled-coil domain-containing protein 136 [Merluccius polli]
MCVCVCVCVCAWRSYKTWGSQLSALLAQTVERSEGSFHTKCPTLSCDVTLGPPPAGHVQLSLLSNQRSCLLEDERLASAHQAEAFTRQIQNLQAQLRSVQEEMDSLEEEKESELAEAQEELRVAQEEVVLLQQGAEEAAAERENDIASLQEELCRLRAQMERLGEETQEYELEITTLRAEISMKSQRRDAERREGERQVAGGGSVTSSRGREGDVGLLKDECSTLREECQALKEENRQLSERLQLLHRQRTSSSSIYLSLKEEDADEEEEEEEAEGGGGADPERKQTETASEACAAESYMTMMAQTEVGPGGGGRRVDASIQKNISFDGKAGTPMGWNGGLGEIYSLREQLKQAEEKALQVQRECDSVKTELQELQVLYDSSQQEKAGLEAELQHCKAELEKLLGGAQSFIHPSEHPILSIPFIGLIVIVAVIWCWLSELASQRARRTEGQGSEVSWDPVLTATAATAILLLGTSLLRAVARC